MREPTVKDLKEALSGNIPDDYTIIVSHEERMPGIKTIVSHPEKFVHIIIPDIIT